MQHMINYWQHEKNNLQYYTSVAMESWEQTTIVRFLSYIKLGYVNPSLSSNLMTILLF